MQESTMINIKILNKVMTQLYTSMTHLPCPLLIQLCQMLQLNFWYFMYQTLTLILMICMKIGFILVTEPLGALLNRLTRANASLSSP